MLHGESCPAHTYTLDLGHTSTLRFHFWLVALSPSTSGSSAELLTCNSRTITLLQVTAISGFLTGLSASTSASPFSLVSTQKPEWFFYCELSNHVLLNSMFFCLRVKSKSFQWLFRYLGVSLPMRTRGSMNPLHFLKHTKHTFIRGHFSPPLKTTPSLLQVMQSEPILSPHLRYLPGPFPAFTILHTFTTSDLPFLLLCCLVWPSQLSQRNRGFLSLLFTPVSSALEQCMADTKLSVNSWINLLWLLLLSKCWWAQNCQTVLS